MGYIGLMNRRKKRKPKESHMKKHKHNQPGRHKESEHEELIRLRSEIRSFKAENKLFKKENEFFKTENAVIKKRNSLERAKGDSASQGEKAAIVQELRAEGYRLTYLLKAMELSRSTYYFEIGKKILLHSEMKAC